MKATPNLLVLFFLAALMAPIGGLLGDAPSVQAEEIDFSIRLRGKNGSVGVSRHHGRTSFDLRIGSPRHHVRYRHHRYPRRRYECSPYYRVHRKRVIHQRRRAIEYHRDPDFNTRFYSTHPEQDRSVHHHAHPSERPHPRRIKAKRKDERSELLNRRIGPRQTTRVVRVLTRHGIRYRQIEIRSAAGVRYRWERVEQARPGY